MKEPGQRVTIEGRDQVVLVSGNAQETPEYAPRNGRVMIRAVEGSAVDLIEGRRRFEVTVDGWLMNASIEPSLAAALRERASRAAIQMGHHGPAVLRAQIPGRVVRVWVAKGEAVEAGQRLLAVEAMKMENEVRSPRAGTVDSVRAAVGHTVEAGDELVTIG